MRFLLYAILSAASPMVQPVQSSKQPEIFSQDHTLDRTVDLGERGEPMEGVLARISGASGPKLTAGGDSSWERISAYARNRPVWAVMSDLGTLLHYELRAEGSGDSLRYTLAPLPGTRRYEKDLHRETLERGASPLFRLPAYLNTPQEEWERLFKDQYAERPQLKQPTDPLIRENIFLLSRSGPRLALNVLKALSTEQRFEMLSEEELILNGGNINEHERLILRSMGLDQGQLLLRIGKAPEGVSADDYAAAAEQYGLILSVRVHPVTGAVLSYGYGVGGGVMGAGSFNTLPPPEPVLPVRGNPYGHRPALRPAPYAPPVYPLLERMRLASAFKPDWGKDPPWRKVIRQLSRHVALPIYSDDYRFIDDPPSRRFDPGRDVKLSLKPLPDLSTVALPAALDAICDRYHYLWWYQDGALFFRSRTWFIERQYEYPPAVEAFIRERVEKVGRFDEDCIDAMAKLTRRQMKGLCAIISYDGDTNSSDPRSELRYTAVYGGAGAWEYFRILANLGSALKRKALSDAGVPFKEMPAQAQRAYLTMMFRLRGVAALAIAHSEVIHVLQGHTPARGLGPNGTRAWLNFNYGQGQQTYRAGGISVAYVPKDSEPPGNRP